MNTVEKMVIDARREERIARAEWFATLDEFQERATPSSIAGEAWEGIQETIGEFTDKAVDAARKRPATLVAIGSAIGLLLFRKRISSAISARFAERGETEGPDRAFEDDISSSNGAMPALGPQPTMTEET